MKARNNYKPGFKTKVVLEILSEEETVNQVAAKYETSPVVPFDYTELLQTAGDIVKVII